MKNEKYDVWISLPGSFTNIPKFTRDIEKEIEPFVTDGVDDIKVR